MFEDEYETVDFRAAPAGWHVIHVDEADWCSYIPAPDGTGLCATCQKPKPNDVHLRLYYAPLPGWLIQQEKNSGRRRVVPAEIDEGEVIEVENLGRWNTSAWCISGPGDKRPTVEEIIEWRTRRANERRVALAKLAQRAQHKLAA
jgi:hypothetical protein